MALFPPPLYIRKGGKKNKQLIIGIFLLGVWYCVTIYDVDFGHVNLVWGLKTQNVPILDKAGHVTHASV